jgi:hypothetical protein
VSARIPLGGGFRTRFAAEAWRAAGYFAVAPVVLGTMARNSNGSWAEILPGMPLDRLPVDVSGVPMQQRDWIFWFAGGDGTLARSA